MIKVGKEKHGVMTDGYSDMRTLEVGSWDLGEP